MNFCANASLQAHAQLLCAQPAPAKLVADEACFYDRHKHAFLMGIL